MANLQKITYTEWYDAEGRRVKPGTPGAAKRVRESTKWYAFWREGKRQMKVPLCTDKTAAQTMLADLMRKKDRVKARIIDPRQEHYDRKIVEHLDEFLPVMRANGKSERDKDRKETILRAFVADLRSLTDLTHDAVDHYLAGVKGSAGNKKKHLSAISVWVKWLLKKDRIETNPLDRVDAPSGGKKVKERRALTAEQIQKLLDAARSRPLAAFHKRYGTEVKPTVRQKERAQQARAAAQAKLVTLGRERALIYKTAVYTGLRLGEIASLRPCHLELGRKPFPRLEIPGKQTKNGQQARLLLVPAFAGELAAWIEDTGKGPDDALFHVPQASVRIMQSDLAVAGIPYHTSQGDADFHSLRMTANVMLGQAGIPARIRQLFMRHSDIRLTMATYDDESFLDLESAVKAMESLKLR
jgi:integrase